MKILVMSDIHYPFTKDSDIKRIISKEKPEKLVLTGDIIVEPKLRKRFFDLIPKNLRKRTYFITGDEDRVKGDYEKLEITSGKRTLVFMHGHQFNIKSDKITAKIARAFKMINRDLPLFAFSLCARKRLHLKDEYLFLGHTHGLRKFNMLKTTCCGTLSELKGVYSDRGYVIITRGDIKTVKL